MAKPAKPAKPAADGAVAPKSKLMLVLPVVTAVLGVGLGATQGDRFFGSAAAAPAGEAHAEAPAAAEPAEPGEFHEIEGLIVNPADSGGRRFLLINLAFEADAAAVEALKTRDIAVRDAIVGVLGRQTVSGLAAAGAREALKDSILQHVNTELGTDAAVRRLYFTQYVLQ